MRKAVLISLCIDVYAMDHASMLASFFPAFKIIGYILLSNITGAAIALAHGVPRSLDCPGGPRL